jgi:hypothetical protein
MTKQYLPVGIFLALISATGQAASICEEAIVQFSAASKAYKSEGGEAFIKRLFKDGPLEEDKRALSQVQSLTQIEQFFGTFQTSSVISTKPLGAKTCYLVGILEYSNGPAFTAVTYYQASKGVTTTSMFFRSEPEALFPIELLIEQRVQK